MSDLNCPYCDAGLDVCHDDGFGYQEDVNHQMECSDCGKNFVFTTSISFYYEPEQADCLNDGEHDFNPTITIPEYAMQMECQMCGERRKPTPEEKLKHNISEYKKKLNKL